MTRRELVDRIDHWRLLIAPEWQVTLAKKCHPGHKDQPIRAVVQAADDYLHATAWIDPRWRKHAAVGELDVTIIHELLHLLMRELRRTLDLIRPIVDEQAYAILEARFQTEEERLVERVARIVGRIEHPDGMLYGVDML